MYLSLYIYTYIYNTFQGLGPLVDKSCDANLEYSPICLHAVYASNITSASRAIYQRFITSVSGIRQQHM